MKTQGMSSNRKGYIEGVAYCVGQLLRSFGNVRETRKLWSIISNCTEKDLETAGVDKYDIEIIKQNFVLK